ncbi:Zn-dependent protease (includes SpoIVFB) [Abditibacterium utsteinense]|uniref:Zn-dependent protease (Includes SpoIVFB) n=1 Tax=Abditibacterium utsteinense TaxID=1960156 RepID=A0A2S8SW43_9BACT|nr:site-2 protease family protein [Abditibacterium utsteinense]PQV65012.1 Zn-dependent protease (includes SpoIVFB) [Abditibacterium utsteinense]
MPTQQAILGLLCAIPALLAGLTFHEFAHAWAADKLGDDTPRREGRLSLDPMVHIDPFGALFFIISSLAGYGLGWAKPVMTNPRNLQHPRRDSLLIAIAGPISNILQTPIWMLLLFIFGYVAQKMNLDASSLNTIAGLVFRTLLAGVLVNISLAAFNMIPIPPLDGHWVLQSIGGRPIEELFEVIRPYSFIILIGIINFTPLLSIVLGPVRNFAFDLALNVIAAGTKLAL